MGIKLVAFDGSETSRKALVQAESLLRPDDELLVVMVVPVATWVPGPGLVAITSPTGTSGS